VPSPEPAFSEQFFQSRDGLRLYYRQFGRRADTAGRARLSVLCLPGLTRNSRDFEVLAQHLAQGHHVVTPDLRGRGRSAYDANWANYNPAKYVEDAFQLLEELGIERCAIIGTSLGGLMGMIMAALQPQRVAGLVVNDIGPELDPAGVARIRSYAGKLPPVTSWREAGAQAKQVHASALPDLDDEGWLDFARRTYRQENGGFRPDVDPNIARTFGDPSSSAPDLWPFFEKLASTPLLTIRGELSDLFGAGTLQRMQQIKPDMQTLVVANRGHAPTLAEPECLAAIEQFLNKLGGA